MKALLAATAVVAVLAVPALAQDTKHDPSRGDTVQKPGTPVAPGVIVVPPRPGVSGDDKGEKTSEGGTTGTSGGTTGGGTTGGGSTGGGGTSDGGGSGSGGSGGGGGGTK